MKNSKKSALLVSFIAILLCVTMLIGTTFAWFTDTASTGVNKIVAGNLDMELSYSEDLKTWTEVDVTTHVFKDDTLWEPGHAEVVYLKVANVGTLALKYNLGINIASETQGTNVAGEKFKLSDYIQYGIVELNANSIAYTKRADAIAAVATPAKLNEAYTDEVVLLPGASTVVAMVAYMPETVGNEANYLTGTTAPEISLGITATAIQTPYEEDSFGDDYDKTAPVQVKGIAGFEDKTYDTIQQAYEDIQPTIEALAGLDQNTATNEQFDAVFTDGGKITWMIGGRQQIDNPLIFSFGRTAAYYNPDRWINNYEIIGVGPGAELVFTEGITLPRNWWTYATDPVSISFSNLTLTEKPTGQISVGQANTYTMDVNIDKCTVNGNIYIYHNNTLNMNITNSVFNSQSDSYALMMQGDHPGTIKVDNCTFNQYSRGVNFQRSQTDFILTNNTFVSNRAEADRGVVQITDGKSFVVTGNTIKVNQGNAFWFHDAATNSNATYTISDNDISATYLANDGVKFDVNSKITSSGNKFNGTDTVNCMRKNTTTVVPSTITAIK